MRRIGRSANEFRPRNTASSVEVPPPPTLEALQAGPEWTKKTARHPGRGIEGGPGSLCMQVWIVVATLRGRVSNHMPKEKLAPREGLEPPT